MLKLNPCDTQDKTEILKNNSKEIFIVAGGTGGHIIPARCFADFLTKNNQPVSFFGDEKIISYIKNTDSFGSLQIKSSQLKRSPIFLLKAAIKILIGIVQSGYFLLKKKPQFVIAFGGYATFPMLIATVIFGTITKTKIILHEQNSHLGKVNRIFAAFSYKIALSFAATSGIKNEHLAKTHFTGNLVRPSILRLNKFDYSLPINFDEKKSFNNSDAKNESDNFQNLNSLEDTKTKESFNILIIGGSGGAKIFSDILPKAFFGLSTEIKNKIHITQQCRKELIAATLEEYNLFSLDVTMDSFFDDMPKLISEAHLVIARSGSSSIFEFCAAKKPMILIPFANSADDHQEKNASYLESKGAAIVVREKDFTVSNITKLLNDVIGKVEVLKKMSLNASNLAVLDAEQNLAKLIYE